LHAQRLAQPTSRGAGTSASCRSTARSCGRANGQWAPAPTQPPGAALPGRRRPRRRRSCCRQTRCIGRTHLVSPHASSSTARCIASLMPHNGSNGWLNALQGAAKVLAPVTLPQARAPSTPTFTAGSNLHVPVVGERCRLAATAKERLKGDVCAGRGAIVGDAGIGLGVQPAAVRLLPRVRPHSPLGSR
jgi:hypothetical protein